MEIRNLRQRLEESICTNDRLREQLERRLASTGKANGTALHGARAAGGQASAHLSAHPVHNGALGRDSALVPFTGLPSDVYAQTPELGLQLSRENQALHEENRTLRLQRDHLSQGRAGADSQRALPE